MVGTASEIGDTDYDSFNPDLSPVSDRSNGRANAGDRVDDKYNIFNEDSSLLGVIVDRSSFDEDDELTTYGNGGASVFHGRPVRINLPLHEQLDVGSPMGGVVMKNGKVRRKMRWKPRFRKPKNSNQFSSNASVVSALTNRSSSTSRSSMTTRSFLSHFSRKSNTSFHTFHSTETPVATNKANRPKAPHAVMRPDYQDSFDAKPKHATIETEGTFLKNRKNVSSQFSVNSGFTPTKLDSVMEFSPVEELEFDRSSTLNSDKNSKSSDAKSGIDINITKSSSNNSVGATSAISSMSKESPSKPPIPLTIKSTTKSPPQQQSKLRRPPLFKRRLRKNKSANMSTTSPNVSSPTDTNSTASLSSAISLERENSGLPVLTGDESDRRVQIDITRSLFTDLEDSPPRPIKSIEAEKVEEETPEENSVSPTVQSSISGSQSGGASNSSLTRNTTPVSLQNRVSSKQSTSTSSNSTASPNRGGSSTETPPSPVLPKPRTKNSVPCDLDEGAFLEAEHNLRAIHEMAAEHLAHGEYEEAADVFEEILRGQQERYGQDHYRVGTALHNLGIVHLKKGDFEKAIEICQRAVDVRKDSLVPNHPDVAVSLSQLGVAHLESRNYHEALAAFRDALNIRRNFLGPRHMKCAKILNNIGCALYSVEDLAEAKKAFDEALDIQRQGLRSLPIMEGSEANDIANGMQSNTLLLSMASTLCNIGSIRLRWGDFGKAEIALEEALLIQQSVLGDEHPVVNGTIESIGLIETAKHCAANPESYNAYLMKTAAAACTVENPRQVVTEMLGMSNLDEDDWFLNPCAPVSYIAQSHE